MKICTMQMCPFFISQRSIFASEFGRFICWAWFSNDDDQKITVLSGSLAYSPQNQRIKRISIWILQVALRKAKKAAGNMIFRQKIRPSSWMLQVFASEKRTIQPVAPVFRARKWEKQPETGVSAKKSRPSSWMLFILVTEKRSNHVDVVNSSQKREHPGGWSTFLLRKRGPSNRLVDFFWWEAEFPGGWWSVLFRFFREAAGFPEFLLREIRASSWMLHFFWREREFPAGWWPVLPRFFREVAWMLRFSTTENDTIHVDALSRYNNISRNIDKLLSKS